MSEVFGQNREAAQHNYPETRLDARAIQDIASIPESEKRERVKHGTDIFEKLAREVI